MTASFRKRCFIRQEGKLIAIGIVNEEQEPNVDTYRTASREETVGHKVDVRRENRDTKLDCLLKVTIRSMKKSKGLQNACLAVPI